MSFAPTGTSSASSGGRLRRSRSLDSKYILCVAGVQMSFAPTGGTSGGGTQIMRKVYVAALRDSLMSVINLVVHPAEEVVATSQ